MERHGKIAIIGAGYVGASICYALMLKMLAQEIVLIDSNEQKSQGEAMDIVHGIPYMGNSRVYAGTYKDCQDCDVIIITAGRNRRPGQLRTDLVEENTVILHQISMEIKKYYNGGVILVVSNPVDIMTYKMEQWMELPEGMVFGTGCILDKMCIRDRKYDLSEKKVLDKYTILCEKATEINEMVSVIRYTTVSYTHLVGIMPKIDIRIFFTVQGANERNFVCEFLYIVCSCMLDARQFIFNITGERQVENTVWIIFPKVR